jgi:hypothetical protein
MPLLGIQISTRDAGLKSNRQAQQQRSAEAAPNLRLSLYFNNPSNTGSGTAPSRSAAS